MADAQHERQQQASHSHQMPIPSSDNPLYEGMINCIGALPKFSAQGSVGLIQRFGKYYRAVDPGLYYINLFTENLIAIDIKVQVEDIPRQVVMTKDNVTVTIDSGESAKFVTRQQTRVE
ncbi:hypothetical protein HDU93_009259 [Gonapodya sp. JEL0774]|nr:hypothetical protein HDU93_009259 [Gonapodya sp. JEL0774]